MKKYEIWAQSDSIHWFQIYETALFREESRTKKSFAITFITTFGIAQNIHAGLAQNELTAEALFR